MELEVAKQINKRLATIQAKITQVIAERAYGYIPDKEVEKRFGYTKSTLKSMRLNGKLNDVRVAEKGSKFLYSIDELEALFTKYERPKRKTA